MVKKLKNIIFVLRDREKGFSANSIIQWDLQHVAEEKAAVCDMEEVHCKLPTSVRSTFLMSFSPDSTKVASTHGDHKIYICDVKTGKLLHRLEGHPRTPWCLAFHPTSNDILASGCLGGEVRVWDLHGGSEKWAAEFSAVITSLAFHPLDKVLVIATFNQIHFWDWSLPEPFATCKTSSDREKVRFVKFDRLGNKLITGIANQPDTHCCHAEQNSYRRQARTSSESSGSSSSSAAPHRSLLSRLINMYTTSSGASDGTLLLRPMSPAQEEALSQARRYAAITTQATRLRRQLMDAAEGAPYLEAIRSSATGGLSSSLLDSSDDGELAENHEEFLLRAFWRTFHRLCSICHTLERRMMNIQNDNPLDLSLSTGETSTSSTSTESTPRTSHRTASPQRLDSSNHLINILTRLQNSLQFSAVTNAVAQEQLQQLQCRITEILERLTNVTGYRARLTTLRDQIFEVAERSGRRSSSTSSAFVRRRDLAHCLWLVEMSLQLTQQMQRILHADYRLTQLHLNSSSSSSNTQQQSSNNSTHSSFSHISQNCILCGSLNNSTSSDSDIFATAREQVRELTRRQRELRQQFLAFPRRVEAPRIVVQSTDGLYSSHWDNPTSSSERIPLRTLSTPNSQSSRNHYVNIGSEDDDDDDDEPSNTRNFEHMEVSYGTDTPGPSRWPGFGNINTNLSSWSPPLHRPVEVFSSSDDETSNIQTAATETVSRTETINSNIRTRNESQSTIQSDMQAFPSSIATAVEHPPNNLATLYIPEVQIEPSPEDLDPLPIQERPRSPPLPIILYGQQNDALNLNYLNFFHSFSESTNRPRYSVHEASTSYFHRIQCWDFSKYEIPNIKNAKANIVVPKCKIHNDASVDISKDGEMLVALIPSIVPSIESLTFAVYSLRQETLGQCLYTWGYDSNAISVNFSPLGQYIVVGFATPRAYLASADKEAVAHIFKIKPATKGFTTVHVRSLTQRSNTGNHQVSLNSVQWLPQPGHGLIYGTNRGCLCICKPVYPMSSLENKFNRLIESSSFLGMRSHISNFTPSQRMFSASTQTVDPETQTTGTQTLGTERSSSTR